MKIALVGCGAMGSLIGGKLAAAGQKMFFVDPWKEHVDAINKNGLLMVESATGAEEIVRVTATTNPDDVGVVDVIIFLVKGTKSRETIQRVKGMIDDDTIVVTFQNGLGNTDLLAEYVNPENVAFGVIDSSAGIDGPGKIHYQLADGKIACDTHTGNKNEKFEKLLEVLNKAGFDAYLSDDATYRIWNKLVVNANYNVLCGIIGVRLGELISVDEGRKLIEGITRELIDVANAKGIMLDYNESMEHMKDFGLKISLHYPSLAQDVARKVPTEIDFLNGAIVREGKKVGIPTPINETVYNILKVIEANYDVGKEFSTK